MENTPWLKQQETEPLFPDMLWSRPVTKARAGKLLIIGGNAHGFTAPASAFVMSQKAGIGTVRVLLPDVLRKTLGKSFEAGEFAPSTPSGSFAKGALAEMLDLSAWADGVLLAGDLGHNSETTVLQESYLAKYSGQLTLTNDALDNCLTSPLSYLKRPRTTLVLSMAQLQKLASAAKFTSAFTLEMGIVQLVDKLYEFAKGHSCNFIVQQSDNLVVAVEKRISTTKNSKKMGLTELATRAAVWNLQNPDNEFEALTTALFQE